MLPDKVTRTIKGTKVTYIDHEYGISHTVELTTPTPTATQLFNLDKWAFNRITLSRELMDAIDASKTGEP